MRKGTLLSGTRPGLSGNRLVDFQYLRAMGYEHFAGAAVGEVLHTAARVHRAGGSREAFVRAWTALGRRVAGLAAEAEGRGHRPSARDRYLRAYNYLRVAEFNFDRRRPAEHRALYEESVGCFDRAIALLGRPAGRIEIPYEQGLTLPGYLFRPADDGRARPTVLVCGGGDGHGEEMYFLAGVPAALERGFNVVLFHLPGQRGVLHRDAGQVLRPDAEAPVGAVIDFAASQPGVDADRMALYGLSAGGYHVLRAAARDSRPAAVVASAPLPDVFEALLDRATESLPGFLQERLPRRLASLSPQAWTRILDPLRRLHWAVDVMVDNYLLWTTGTATVGEAVAALRRFRLGELESAIRAPVLCLWSSGEGEALRRRIHRFQRTVAAPTTFEALVGEDGADGHCGVGNVAHTAAVAYDWLAEHFHTGNDAPVARATVANGGT